MDKRYQVFVSSTYADLKQERQHVIQALIEMDCIPAGMELFPAADEEQWEFIKKVIDDCDYYLLVIGGRYGSVTSEGISYTEKEFDYAPFGMTGLETALSVCAEVLIEEKVLKWIDLIRKMSTVPCEILGYERGTLKEGAAADIVIIDPDGEWVFEKEKIESRSSNSPFVGKKMKAKVTDVIMGGHPVVKDGKLL